MPSRWQCSLPMGVRGGKNPISGSPLPVYNKHYTRLLNYFQSMLTPISPLIMDLIKLWFLEILNKLYYQILEFLFVQHKHCAVMAIGKFQFFCCKII